MGKMTLNVGSSKEGNDKEETIILEENEQDFFFEFIKKLLEAKKKITGDINSNEGLIITISYENSLLLVIENMEFKPVYTFENFKDMFKVE